MSKEKAVTPKGPSFEEKRLWAKRFEAKKKKRKVASKARAKNRKKK